MEQKDKYLFGVEVVKDDAGAETYVAFRLEGLREVGVEYTVLFAEGKDPYDAIGSLCDKISTQVWFKEEEVEEWKSEN